MRPLLAVGDCVLPADLGNNDAYSDLVVITAVSLSERRVTDVNCVSTDVNGVYVSRDSLYVGGIGISLPEATFTVLHKFALNGGDISYRATGVVGGQLGWQNASYFMDEDDGNLRILTSQFSASSGDFVHRLYTLHEVGSNQMQALAILPNPQRPTPIGKPGEQVHAVRFFGDRAYVVTARVVDPLYVLDLERARRSGHRRHAGNSRRLDLPAAARRSRRGGWCWRSAVRPTTPALRDGVKIELFDVHDILRPRSVGSQVFGRRGSCSEATSDPHALTLYSRADAAACASRCRSMCSPRRVRICQRVRLDLLGLASVRDPGIGGSTPQLE